MAVLGFGGLSGFQGASRIPLDLILAQGSPVRTGLGALRLVKAPCGQSTLYWDLDPTEGVYVYIISPSRCDQLSQNK